ncbi:hypothetical protein ABZ442_30600 [Streptomyces triculaminicus]|uniref:hypothetical protein n=1 Tax=Streptomyces triculaminicus TaxID=2816232 RepID=UPI0034040657
MFSTSTAPDLAETVTEAIRAHRDHVAADNRRSYWPSIEETAGRFSTIGEAVVEVELRIRFGKRYVSYDKDDEYTIAFTASARCTGHGCTDPRHQQPATDTFLLDDDADKSAAAALLSVAAVRKWAQTHAGTCRALRYDGR